MNSETLQYVIDLAMEYAPRVVLAVIVLIIGWWLIGRINRMVGRSFEKRDIDPSVRSFAKSCVSVGLKVLLILSIASMFGVKTASFVAILAAMAFAVGMALQGSLSNFASGIMLLVFKPYKVGDLVELQGETGHVKEVQIFNTIVTTLDNQTVIIPNSVVTANVIKNISAEGIIRVDMTFGIGYGDDIDKARSIIQEVADTCPEVLKKPEVEIFVSELADSSVNFVVRPWCESDDFWPVYFYMHEHIKKAFDRQGVSIPFPQMDVHMNQN